MTSQPLVASVCVDYLSHPLSAEGLLLCYQQITRQVAHAPQTAKEAASTFQNHSNAELDLLQQHSYNLAIPNKRDHRGPAPVGCQAQLRRMQNALWRRSSQLSLAKDVVLVQPETLNWQKECDVLWLYGPLYHPYFATADQAPSLKTATMAQAKSDPPAQDYFSLVLPSSPPPSISTATAVHSAPDTTVVATITSSPSSPGPFVSSPQLSTTTAPPPPSSPPPQRHHRRMTVDASSATELTPRPLRSASISNSDTALAAKAAHAFPKKSSLKRLGTRQQQLEELRAFLRSNEYRVLTQILTAAQQTAAHAAAVAASTAMSPITTTPTGLQREDGTCSAPVTPVMANPPMLAMPLVPAPSRYHFRSTDRQRRASFPKYATHPASSSSLSTATLPSSPSSLSGGLSTTGSASLNGKQLRFSLEVQELVFLPSSPPFRVSRAKPVRANSDPAVLSSTTASYMAPSPAYPHGHDRPYPHHHQHHPYSSGDTCSAGGRIAQGCFATATSGNRTMMVRVGGGEGVAEGNHYGQARMMSRAHQGLALDLRKEDEESLYGVWRGGATATTTAATLEEDAYEYHHQYHHPFSTASSLDEQQHDKRKHCYHQAHYKSTTHEVDQDDVDVDDEIFFPTVEAIPEHDGNSNSTTGTVARRIDQQQQQHKGVLWQVYTVVTGVRDIVAWCGSMVYYSSTL